jgi:hypothetical protein
MKAKAEAKWRWIPWLGCYTFHGNDWETTARADAAEDAFDRWDGENLRYRARKEAIRSGDVPIDQPHFWRNLCGS